MREDAPLQPWFVHPHIDVGDFVWSAFATGGGSHFCWVVSEQDKDFTVRFLNGDIGTYERQYFRPAVWTWHGPIRRI